MVVTESYLAMGATSGAVQISAEALAGAVTSHSVRPISCGDIDLVCLGRLVDTRVHATRKHVRAFVQVAVEQHSWG